jgi:hypothetical protein
LYSHPLATPVPSKWLPYIDVAWTQHRKRIMWSPCTVVMWRHFACASCADTKKTAAVLLHDTTAYVKMCLPSHCLKMGCITPLFYCCRPCLAMDLYCTMLCPCGSNRTSLVG